MELLLIGKTPISPDSPTGSDLRYEPEYEEIQNEIDKLSSPSASNVVNWKRVIDLGTEILSKKSKDILIASYLGVGLVNAKQLEGLDISINIFADLIETFWENLYPPKKRMKGRLNAMQWWVEKCELNLTDIKPPPMQQKDVDKIKGNLQRIESLLAEYTQTPINFEPIKRFINSIPIKPESKSVSETSKGDEGKESKRDIGVLPDEIETPKDANRVLASGFQRVRQVAAYLQQQDPANPNAYRLMRLAAWGTIETLPPAVNGKTQIPPPPVQIKNILADLSSKGEWENLLKSAEQKVSQFIFWLDLNCYVALALEKLPEKYKKAYDAVCLETAFFIKRLKGLESFTFSDNTPMAALDTKKWLKEISLQTGGSGAPSTGGDTGGDPFQQELQRAQELARGQQVDEAVGLLQNHLMRSFSHKERLMWRMELSQMLINYKRARVALPHLHQILEDIETYRLEEWDPELSLKGLRIVWKGFNAQKDTGSKARVLEVLDRIAKLNPSEAMSIEKG